MILMYNFFSAWQSVIFFRLQIGTHALRRNKQAVCAYHALHTSDDAALAFVLVSPRPY